MPVRLLHAGNTLIVEGPSTVKIVEGKIESIGAPLPVGQRIVIKSPRQTAFYALETSLLQFDRKSSGSIREVQGSTIPTSWSETVEIMKKQRSGVAVILGDVDSGKSTLCTYLANELHKQRRSVAVIDGDIGQADIGPPATITGALVNRAIMGLQELEPEHSFFIGDTSPFASQTKIIDSLVRLKNTFQNIADFILVNTDGWIRDALALQFKTELLTRTKPDLTIGIASDTEIDPLLDNTPTKNIFKIKRSDFAKARTKAERKKAREIGYRRFLTGSHTMKYDIEKLQVGNARDSGQTLFVEGTNIPGRFSGLLRNDGEMISCARIIGRRGKNLLVETRTVEKPSHIELGVIQLSAQYEEIGYFANLS